MTFKEFLLELLNSKYDWPGLESGNNLVLAKFEDDSGQEIVVHCSRYTGPDDLWEVEFTRDGAHHMTGGGDAIKVFSTVLDIVHEFCDAKDPHYITFSSKVGDASRVKLYKRLAKKVEAFGYKDISDTAVEEMPKMARIMKQRTGEHTFLLVRK